MATALITKTWDFCFCMAIFWACLSITYLGVLLGLLALVNVL